MRTAGRGALDGRLGVGLGQVLDFALLAVLYSRTSRPSAPSVPVRPNVSHPDLLRPTYRPLREPQVLLAPALGRNSLVLLQAAAHDAGSDGEVAVVAAKRRGLALASCPFCLSPLGPSQLLPLVRRPIVPRLRPRSQKKLPRR